MTAKNFAICPAFDQNSLSQVLKIAAAPLRRFVVVVVVVVTSSLRMPGFYLKLKLAEPAPPAATVTF
jgi:hypothetical protein